MSTDYASLSGQYAFDPTHSTIGFVARHAMVTKVRGGVQRVRGHDRPRRREPGRQHRDRQAKVASVDTRNEQRNGHLLSGDFFEQDKYPDLIFRSTGVKFTGDETFVLSGELTVKDVTREVEFEAEFTGAAVDPFGNSRIGFEAKTTVSRKDFGMTWNAALETGGVLVSDKIQIELEISAIKQYVTAGRRSG